jgi:hypothetical protein
MFTIWSFPKWLGTRNHPSHIETHGDMGIPHFRSIVFPMKKDGSHIPLSIHIVKYPHEYPQVCHGSEVG